MINIHTHTEYSPLDGSSRLDKLINKVKSLGQNALAITDHGTMSAIPYAYQICQEEGIKLIPGCEFYLNKQNRFHLVLLAKSYTGYRNLLLLHKSSYLSENFYYKPTINLDMLKEHCNGVICTSACLGGELSQGLLKGDYKGSKKLIEEYKNIFGDDYYIEIHTNLLKQQKEINNLLYKLSKETNTKCIVAVDSHYINKEDSYPHEVLLAMQSQKKITDDKRFRFNTSDFYIMNDEDVLEKLNYLPIDFVQECIRNTHEIEEKSNVNVFQEKMPIAHFNNMTTEEESKLLRSKMNKWYSQKYGNIFHKDIVERIRYELDILCNNGYAGYFLIVQDYLNKFRSIKVDTYGIKTNLLVGAGRGSVGGSLVAYALGITQVNPMDYGLLFERFLNKDRLSYPDIDSDFDYEYRHLALAYVNEKYNTAQVGAFGTNSTKKNVRSVLSTFDVSQNEIKRITSKLPPKSSSIDEAIDKSPEFVFAMAKHKKELEVCKAIENIVCLYSTHAAGVVIAPEPIEKYVPVRTNDGTHSEPIISLDKYIIQDFNLIKHDFLGLKYLTIFRRIMARIKKNYGIDIDIWNLPLDDKKVYDYINTDNLLGGFQIDGDSALEIIKRIKPRCFEDIIAAEAICRPGVKEADMYIKNASSNTIPKIHPVVDNILDSTYGAIVYQEQTMLLMNKLTGGLWSLGKADKMRKVKDLQEYKEDFIECCNKAKVVPMDIAEKIWSRFDMSYSFNKSHAVCYAVITYASMWFKTYYYQEFMAEIMEMGRLDENSDVLIPRYIWECKKNGVKILPPDINCKHYGFDEQNGNIVFGLTGIKGVGDKALEEINRVSSKTIISSMKHLFDICNKRILNKRVFVTLIKAGVFGDNKIELLKEYAEIKKDKTVLDNIPEDLSNIKDIYMKWEKEVLGFYLSNHPLDKYYFKQYKDIVNEGLIGGVVMSNKQIVTKKGDNMGFLAIETLEGVRDVVVFPRQYKKYKELLQDNNVLMIKGVKDNKSPDKFIANEISLLEVIKE